MKYFTVTVTRFGVANGKPFVVRYTQFGQGLTENDAIESVERFGPDTSIPDQAVEIWKAEEITVGTVLDFELLQ